MVINLYSDDGNPAKSAASAPEGKSGGGCSSGGCSTGTCGEGLEKVYPTAAVRYGYMKHIGEFRYPTKDMKFGCGAKVIIQTRRGIELGEMVSLTCDGCDKCVSRDQIKAYIDASGPEYFQFGNGKILRLASEDDLSDWEHIRAESLRKKKLCQQQAMQHRLEMKVIECEHLFGGERIVFYFMAEGRVDFRTLVREMATEFQTRIEMRQVGARDEARLLADYETCGRECCCKNFLKELKPVSMKMAKMQKATLDPAKVSGRCGRLKCCLRYEHTTYEEMDKTLPRNGSRVMTEHGPGVVVGRQILTQLLQVRTEEGGLVTVPVEDLNRNPAPPKTDDATPSRPADRSGEGPRGDRDRSRRQSESRDTPNRARNDRDKGDQERGDREPSDRQSTDREASQTDAPSAEEPRTDGFGEMLGQPPITGDLPRGGLESTGESVSGNEIGDQDSGGPRRKRRSRRGRRKGRRGDGGGPDGPGDGGGSGSGGESPGE